MNTEIEYPIDDDNYSGDYNIPYREDCYFFHIDDDNMTWCTYDNVHNETEYFLDHCDPNCPHYMSDSDAMEIVRDILNRRKE